MLWTQETVTFHGRHFNLDGVRPTHRPIQKPHPPIWIAANNFPAIRRAARLGAVLYASPHAHNGTLKEQIAVYKEAVAGSSATSARGHSRSKGHLRSRQTDEEAFAACRPYFENRYKVYEDQGQDQELPEGDRFNLPFEELARDRFLIGSPETVIKGVERLLDMGFNHIVFYTQHPGLPGDLAYEVLQDAGREGASGVPVIGWTGGFSGPGIRSRALLRPRAARPLRFIQAILKPRPVAGTTSW